MRHKDTNSANRLKIILEAFKLFSTKSLNEITFADIEKATGLSRGGILHYFGSKDKLYAEVMDHYILKRNNNVTIDPQKDLWDNIKEFINYRKKQQDHFNNIGICNINRAHTYIVTNAMHLIEDIERKSAIWLEIELSYWREILTLAQQKGELKKDIDINIEAKLFYSVFLGNSYMAITTPNGYDLDKLQDQFYTLYTQIVNNKRDK